MSGRMKKLLLASSLIFGVSGLVAVAPVAELTASAKTYDMSANLANHIKKGTFPGLKGKMGDSFNHVEKLNPRATWSKGTDHHSLDLPKEQFSMTSFLDYKWNNSYKVDAVTRSYTYTISEKSVRKYFGKPYKGIDWNGKRVANSHVYKAGKYYMFFSESSSYSKNSWIVVGKKVSAVYYSPVQKIYR